MMKKFSLLLILLLFYSTHSNAGVLGKYLKKRMYTQYALFNSFVDDYNKFKKNYNSEVMIYCKNQMVKGAGINQITKKTTCEYNATVDLLTKYGLNIDPMNDITYSWYKDAHTMAKNTAIGIHSCGGSSCKNDIINSYAKNEINLKTNFIKRLDEGLKKKALKENQKYYAKKKEEEDKGLNIDDSEIIPASSGSGFFVSKNGHMITNFHVIDGCSKIKAVYDGDEYDSSVLAVDKVNDLAIIKANINNQKAFSISNDGPQLLEDVIVAGFPLGKKVSASIKATSGSVTAMSGNGDNFSEFQVDAALNSGNSGGPIINEKGNVIGVAVSKIQAQGVESFNFGIKSSVVKTFASSNGLKFLSPNSRPMKRKDLGNLVTTATVYLDCWMTGKQLKKILSQNKKSQKAFYSKFQ